MLEEVTPRLAGKDWKIMQPLSEKSTEELNELDATATTKVRTYVAYKGTEASTGALSPFQLGFLPSMTEGEIVDVTSTVFHEYVVHRKYG